VAARRRPPCSGAISHPQGTGTDDLGIPLADRRQLAHLPRQAKRGQLADPDDEIVLEAAANGRSKVIVMHNVRYLQPAAGEFGIEMATPGTFLKRIKR